jgi:ComF family protein
MRYILDVLFPPSHHERLLRTVGIDDFLKLRQDHFFRGTSALLPYHEPKVQAAVASLKFEHRTASAQLLAAVFSQWLSEQTPLPTYLVPIPLHPKRERERGYNQVAEVVQKITPPPYPCHVLPLLIRSKYTVRQTSLERHKRIRNLDGAFSVRTHLLCTIATPARIIICDDVSTTGSTLLAAKNSLKPFLPDTAEIICVAWAH